MEDLLLLITVLQEKSEKNIINLFKYKVGYYILYPALLHNSSSLSSSDFRKTFEYANKYHKILTALILWLVGEDVMYKSLLIFY